MRAPPTHGINENYYMIALILLEKLFCVVNCIAEMQATSRRSITRGSHTRSSRRMRAPPTHGASPRKSRSYLTERVCNVVFSSQLLHKSVSLSFIITNVKNKLTNLCGN